MFAKAVKSFLKENGFKKVQTNVYSNGLCEVIIDNDGYEIISDFGYEGTKHSMFSDNLNIYWLIGVLTYYDYIPKNYKPIKTPKSRKK